MKIVINTFAAVATYLFFSPIANATELWEPHLPGITEGIPAGALPPEGVYADVEIYTLNAARYGANGQTNGLNIGAQVVAPVLLWNTGYKVFGADYAVQIVQPVDFTDLTGNPNGAPKDTIPNNGHWGTYNTVISPVILGWHLPNDLHVKTALDINLNNASSSPAKPTKSFGVGSGNGYTTIMPNLGVSWLSNGWNASANLYYSINTNNSVTNYQSGQMFQGDYTLTKSIDKWNVGLGAFSVNQITSDSGAGAVAAGCGAANGCKERRFGLGPLVAFNFDGGINVHAMFNRDISSANAFGGNIVQIGLFVPLNFK